MHKKNKLVLMFWAIFFGSYTPVFSEQIVQQKNMDFSICLTVIQQSEKNLALSPEITKKDTNYKEVEFKLIDGSLIIKCDGEKGILTVISN